MKVKVITKYFGTFTSDDLKDVEYDDVLNLINSVSKGDTNNLSFDDNGDKIFFPEEVLKNSVFIVTKD